MISTLTGLNQDQIMAWNLQAPWECRDNLIQALMTRRNICLKRPKLPGVVQCGSLKLRAMTSNLCNSQHHSRLNDPIHTNPGCSQEILRIPWCPPKPEACLTRSRSPPRPYRTCRPLMTSKNREHPKENRPGNLCLCKAVHQRPVAYDECSRVRFCTFMYLVPPIKDGIYSASLSGFSAATTLVKSGLTGTPITSTLAAWPTKFSEKVSTPQGRLSENLQGNTATNPPWTRTASRTGAVQTRRQEDLKSATARTTTTSTPSSAAWSKRPAAGICTRSFKTSREKTRRGEPLGGSPCHPFLSANETISRLPRRHRVGLRADQNMIHTKSYVGERGTISILKDRLKRPGNPEGTHPLRSTGHPTMEATLHSPNLGTGINPCRLIRTAGDPRGSNPNPPNKSECNPNTDMGIWGACRGRRPPWCLPPNPCRCPCFSKLLQLSLPMVGGTSRAWHGDHPLLTVIMIDFLTISIFITD